MGLLNSLDAVFLRLSAIPGLGFLHEWVHEIEMRQQRRKAVIGTYKGYVSSIKGAGKEAAGAVRGSRDDQGGQGDSVGHDGHGAPTGDSRTGRDNDDDDDLDQDYEDDDFESYLQ